MLHDNTDQRAYGGMTDSEGRFGIGSVAPGRYWMQFERVGFWPGGTIREMGHQIVLEPGQKMDDLNLTMIPSGAITGRVLDASGEPVESAEVQAEGPGGTAQPAFTDEEGRFRLGGLAPGRYRIRAQPGMQLPFPPERRTDGTQEVHHSSLIFRTPSPRGADRA
jgi:protocatechuate 3,4-dioxygenase beta subunit